MPSTSITFALRLAALALALAACAGDDGQHTYPFGPFEIANNQEVTGSCAQISLNNPDAAYVTSVELTTGPGFHHSNWFFVPETVFYGDDGTFDCSERSFNEAI